MSFFKEKILGLQPNESKINDNPAEQSVKKEKNYITETLSDKYISTPSGDVLIAKGNLPFNRLILLISILLGVIILGGVFYWFEWRPSQIIRKCTGGKAVFTTFDESIYKACLRKNGINE